jgi:hypothetical protein
VKIFVAFHFREKRGKHENDTHRLVYTVGEEEKLIFVFCCVVNLAENLQRKLCKYERGWGGLGGKVAEKFFG